MNVFRIITLGLCVSIPLAHAMNEHPTFSVANTTTSSYTFPKELIDNLAEKVSVTVTQQATKDLAEKAPGFLTKVSEAGKDFIAEGKKAGKDFIAENKEAGDNFIVKGSVAGSALISQLIHNLSVIAGGTVIGSIGAYFFCQGINDLFDRAKDKDDEKYYSRTAKTVLGLGIMGAAGLTVKTFLK